MVMNSDKHLLVKMITSDAIPSKFNRRLTSIAVVG